MKIELDYTSFASWLQSKGRKYVGEQGSCDGCAVALWLAETYPGYSFSIADELLVRARNGDRKIIDLPLWVRAFVADFDNHEPGKEAMKITGNRALTILSDTMRQISEAKLEPASTTAYFPFT